MDGIVKLTLKYPDMLPVLSKCEVATTRRSMTLAREGGQAYGNNLDLVAEGVQLRKQTAALLGYKSWAAFRLESRMAGDPETVTEFMGKIRDLAQPGLAKDLESLRAAKRKHMSGATAKLSRRGSSDLGGGVDPSVFVDDPETIHAWDTSFYHNMILKEDFGVDTEAIREYFPLDHVVETTLEIYQELLSLRFEEIPKGSFESWHAEVRLFVVYDTASGARQGHFYLDLHPRHGKYGHAAIFHLLKRNSQNRNGSPGCDAGQTPVDCMLCNLPAPAKDGPRKGKAALLLHTNVVTFFHEL